MHTIPPPPNVPCVDHVHGGCGVAICCLGAQLTHLEGEREEEEGYAHALERSSRTWRVEEGNGVEVAAASSRLMQLPHLRRDARGYGAHGNSFDPCI